MTGWRDVILQHFREPIWRLTLVADPDGLLLEEELLAAIQENGFDLLTYEDPIAFRHTYEADYRERWDEGEPTGHALILRSVSADMRTLPYDLLKRGRLLSFGLADFLPNLSYPVIRDLERDYLDPLYEAYRQYTGPAMGDRASMAFVLRHVFGVAPDQIKTRAELLKVLVSRRARGDRVPPRLDAYTVECLQAIPAFAAWPLAELLTDEARFFSFLQEHWIGHLASRQPDQHLVRESGVVYDAGDLVPFDDPDVRVYVDTFFVEGKLKPFRLPDGWVVDGWARVGVEVDERALRLQHFMGLLGHLQDEAPQAEATHKDWLRYAPRWARLTVMRHEEKLAPGPEAEDRYRSVQESVEEAFAAWMLSRYHSLHSQPFLPLPTMVHHIPHYLAAYQRQYPGARLALLVLDGMALDQWLVIRDAWSEACPGWSLQENALFAWVPTLTSISRQSIFAGSAPQFFADSWQSTAREESLWRRFWHKQGLHSASVAYLRNLGVKGWESNGTASVGEEATLEPPLADAIDNAQTQVIGLVVNTLDNIMHGMQLGTAGMHQQVRLWLANQKYLTKLVQRLLEASFVVFLTSDHGNVSARGIGQPKEGSLVETRGQRARVYAEPAFAALAKAQFPSVVEWSNVGLPLGLRVLLAPKLSAFLGAGESAVCHGGIALEEVVVPFVQIREEPTA